MRVVMARRTLSNLPRFFPRKRVELRVPATSANMGPGFDCLGIALTEYNLLAVERASSFGIDIVGEGVDSLPRDESNYYYRAFKLGFAASSPAGTPIPPVRLTCTNAIAPARGMGSSSACLVSGVSAGFALSADAVFNIARAATVVNAFSAGKLELLRWGAQDALHQPQRGTLFPNDGLFKVLKAAMGAGAHGAWMSGAGPTICAIVGGALPSAGGRGGRDAMELLVPSDVAAAMVAAADGAGMKGRLIMCQIDTAGVQLI
ncbi:hypothetical protein T492DRAFT_968734 [Pavlovales sp. CCMP2436]|nr:hypothetical protein T492DRAFT_968734 [Pavlovales sp. CCMP2436]